jgi:SAM-dependent methyltransferase
MPPALVTPVQPGPDFSELHNAELFACLRALLSDAGFNAPAVCHRVGITSIYDFVSRREGRKDATGIADRLDLLIRIFMDVELIDRAELDRHFSAAETGVLEASGLLVPFEADPGRCHATSLLYPTEGLWVASDLNVSPLGPAHTVLREDAVYPAITKNTRHFLASLPATPCEDFLELCAGTGIAALRATRYAARTWSVDITERATQFAQFNAALNDITNFTAVRGDLYQGVPDLTFDRIVAHPPYMPALEQKFIFRDGGEDGEQITRRMIAGLPEHLRPGGRFYCTCMLTDRTGLNAEDRVRSMLGAHESEFDVLLVTERLFPPTDYYFRLALAGRAELGEVVRRHEVFQRLGVERLVYGSILIQRLTATRPTFTARRQAGPGSAIADVEWLLGWEAATAEADAMARLVTARPVVSPECHMRLGHVLEAGAWVINDCVLTTTSPFALEARCPAWAAMLVGTCDGRTTVRELHASLRGRGQLPAALELTEFVKFIRSLISGGFLRLPDVP